MQDRILELRRVLARTLRAHPKNWRTHPPAQREAMRGLLDEIGYAGALLTRQLPDGSLQLIDGHLRAETTPDAIVPVLVLDVSAEEADKLLVTFDPVSALAGINVTAVDELLAGLKINHAAVQEMVASLAQKAADSPLSVVSGQLQRPSDDEQPATDNRPLTTDDEQRTATRGETKPRREVKIPTLFQVVVECEGETQQRELYEQLTAAGYVCKVMTL